MEMILIYPVFIGIAIATAELAREKGYKGRWWFLLGILFPVFSVLVLFMLKSKKHIHKDLPAGLENAIKQSNATHNDKILYQKSV